MNPFLLRPDERLADWKQLRKSLPALPEPEQLARVARYFAQAPLAKFTYDVDDLTSWPSPWDMIIEGDWCRSSVAVGMEFTLRLSGWNEDRLTLHHRKDYDISDQFILLQIDDTHVLNYHHGQVVELPQTRADILQSWRFKGRFYRTV